MAGDPTIEQRLNWARHHLDALMQARRSVGHLHALMTLEQVEIEIESAKALVSDLEALCAAAPDAGRES